MRRQMSKKCFRFAKRVDFKPGGFKESGNGFANRCIIIDKTNNRRTVKHATALVMSELSQRYEPLVLTSDQWRLTSAFFTTAYKLELLK